MPTARLFTPLLLLCLFAVGAAKGGAQLYAEELKAHHLANGAPAHPLHGQRHEVLGGAGTAGPFAVSDTSHEVFSHFYEASVGSGHMSLTLREDWRNHIRMAARDLGVKRIRGHGLLDDDMSVSYAYGTHAFFNVDSLVDVLMSVGMRPIFELSFMPDWMTSGTNTVCHYKGNSDPPSDYAQWGELIGALGEHMVAKYGEETASEFMFEVWNEPNDNFWRGGEGHGGVTPAERAQSKQASYFELYTHAALALKKASPKLVVGGPATNAASRWIADFVAHMDNHSVPYDFVSTHAYSSGEMPHLSDAGIVVRQIKAARVILDDATASDRPSHKGGKAPPWIITEFGSSCNQGFGNPDSPRFPSAIHDMIDSSSYTIAVVDALAGPGEPQALSYWAISDVFEESFFPVKNESFHGMFGLVNLHGVPKPAYRAYQLLHETGNARLPVARPPKPTPPAPKGLCGKPMEGVDVWGGDACPVVEPCPTCGLFSVADCCDMCLKCAACDTAELWTTGSNKTHGYRCAMKTFAKKTNVTHNPSRTYARVTRQPSPPPSRDELCATNVGVLAVRNDKDQHVDLILYNHAPFASLIVECNVTVHVSAAVAKGLGVATLRRVDETHANPLAAWIAMGAPDYTSKAQNAALLASSQLVVEKLADVATIAADGSGFVLAVPVHGVAAVRVMLTNDT